MVIELDDKLVPLLRFVIESTVEQWDDELTTGYDVATQDKTFHSFDELLEFTADLTEMPAQLQAIRDRLEPKEEVNA